MTLQLLKQFLNNCSKWLFIDEAKARFYCEKLKQIKLELLGNVKKNYTSAKEETGESFPYIIRRSVEKL